jgi:urea transport system substrate-binding protein
MNKRTLIAVVVVAAVAVGGWLGYRFAPELLQRAGLKRDPIKAGVLHSLSGTMAISEKSVVDATLLAIEEINRDGGLLGREIEPVVADGRSDWPTFAAEAERLITQEGVSVVFGCWTSASRRTVKPIFEEHDHLLFYPVQYEGLEQSENIVYTGAAPNQQIIPAVKWCADHLGKKFVLVGSDYVFPRTANAIIKDQLTAIRGEVLAEEYILLGSTDVDRAVQQIVETQPDVILSTINGDTNVAFFEALRGAGITPDKIPTMSFSIAEDELRTLGVEPMVGDYACWNYFQSVDTEENRRFVAAFRAKYGDRRVTDDPMEAAYFGVYLWAQAVRDAATDDVREVRKALANQTFQAPEGIVYLNAENRHTWKTVRIGRIRKDGQFEIVWASHGPVRPVPYPIYRSPSEWHAFLEDLYQGWGEKWANPGP